MKLEHIMFLMSNQVYTPCVLIISDTNLKLYLTFACNDWTNNKSRALRLEVAAVEGETVEVTAEKPLIEISQTNVARTIDAEAIDNFAVRNVTSMVASQAGVVVQHDGMHIRGSRGDQKLAILLKVHL